MKNKLNVLIVFLLMVSLACLCESSATELPSSSTEAIGEIPDQTTQAPTKAPIQASTQTEPDLYTCDYINNQRKKMTELQWGEYTKSLVGKPIVYEGTITQVYDDGRIQIDACSGIFSGGPFIIYGTPIDVAIKLSKGQSIKGEGTIKEVGTFIVMYIHVNGEIIE